MQSAALPKYGRPPVTEVVCGIYFQDLVLLQVAHVGRLWDRLKADYPRTETMPPLPPALGPQGPAELLIQFSPVEAVQFPRVWFVSDDGSWLVQLQRDRLVVNWRRRNGPDEPYPSYDGVIGRLRHVYAAFIDFLAAEELGALDVLGLEIAYVNTFVFGTELDGPAGIASVVPFLAWSGQVLPLSGLGWNAQLDLPNEAGNLYVHLNTTQRRSDGQGAVRLDLLARKFSPLLDVGLIWNWFDVAHDTVVRTFTDITSPDVQERVWERQQ